MSNAAKTRRRLLAFHRELGRLIEQLTDEQLYAIEILMRTGVSCIQLVEGKFGQRYILAWLRRFATEMSRG